MFLSSPHLLKADSVNEQELLKMAAENKTPKGFPDSEWGARNPFDTTFLKEPTSTKSVAGANADFPLQGIFLGSEKPSAIIGDTVVSVGETVKGLTVKSISEGTVTLSNQEGKEIVLTTNTVKQ